MMYKNKIGMLAASAILLVGVVSNAAGQRITKATAAAKAPTRIVPVSVAPATTASVFSEFGEAVAIVPKGESLSGSYSMKVNAKELSAGITEYSLGQTYGWTSYGTTNGDLSGYIFLSVNYTLAGGGPPLDPGTARPQPIFGASQVTGGSWSKLIFNGDKYVGSVSGRIVGGEIAWGTSELKATIRLELATDNGTDAFAGNVGKGLFEGTLDRTTERASIAGVLTLGF